MKIKLYIVTYKNDKDLNETLATIDCSDIRNFEHQITIINNYHADPVLIDKSFSLNYRVVNNSTRPLFSTGHLSRSWNECLMDAFVNVNTPQTDIAVLCQNDILLKSDVFSNLVRLHKKYNFITYGAGDALHSYSADALKYVGLWDERFCNIGHQEGDYFLRHKIYNPEFSSINDPGHGRLHNVIEEELLSFKNTGFDRKEPSHLASLQYHGVSGNFFTKKWGTGLSAHEYWEVLNTESILLPQYIIYPYFECDFLPTTKNNYYEV